jgi:hypothetical protein
VSTTGRRPVRNLATPARTQEIDPQECKQDRKGSEALSDTTLMSTWVVGYQRPIDSIHAEIYYRLGVRRSYGQSPIPAPNATPRLPAATDRCELGFIRGWEVSGNWVMLQDRYLIGMVITNVTSQSESPIIVTGLPKLHTISATRFAISSPIATECAQAMPPVVGFHMQVNISDQLCGS